MLAVTHPHQHSEGISLEQALTAYTRTGAWAEFEEQDKGTLAPGKYADLAVLSQDIFTVPSHSCPQLRRSSRWWRAGSPAQPASCKVARGRGSSEPRRIAD
jgi:predicted amidohydrolase YtcJ